jgi:hypothetical protein
MGMAELKARSKDQRYTSTVCSGWEVTEEDVFSCVNDPNIQHSIKTTYVHNPRDVDVAAWFLDGEKHGWTML